MQSQFTVHLKSVFHKSFFVPSLSQFVTLLTIYFQRSFKFPCSPFAVSIVNHLILFIILLLVSLLLLFILYFQWYFIHSTLCISEQKSCACEITWKMSFKEDRLLLIPWHTELQGTYSVSICCCCCFILSKQSDLTLVLLLTLYLGFFCFKNLNS